MGKRKTIALIIDWIGTDYHRSILSGVSDYCRSRSWNLIIFVTGRMGATLESEYCRNALFDKLGTVPLDGCIVATASITNLDPVNALTALLEKLPPCPRISLGAPLGPAGHDRRYPEATVTQDVASGVRALLEHVYTKHHVRRLAVIRGPENNPDARERWQAILDFSRDFGLELDEELVWQGDFRYGSGVSAGRYFSRCRNRWDMIVSGNDLMAAGALEVLGLAALIIGFDNLDTAHSYGLSTVEANLTGVVEAACGLLEQIMEGKEAPESETVRCRYVLRTSCGCARPAATVPLSRAAASIGGEERWLELTTDLGEAILAVNGRESLLACLGKNLPPVGIGSWKIVPVGPSQSLVADGSLSGTRPVELMIQALFINRTLSGFCTLDCSSREWSLLEWLRHHISLASSSAFRYDEADAGPADPVKTTDRVMALTASMADTGGNPLDALPVWIIEVDQGLRIRYVNKAGESLFGIDEASLFGRDLLSRFHPADKEDIRKVIHGLATHEESAGNMARILNQVTETVPVLFCAQELSGIKIARFADTGEVGQFEGGFRLSGLNLKPFLQSVTRPETLLYRHYDFTAREKEVIQGMLAGMDIHNLARYLRISENTVKGYMHNVYIKTGVSNKQGFFAVVRNYQKNGIGPQSFLQSLMSSMLYDMRQQ